MQKRNEFKGTSEIFHLLLKASQQNERIILYGDADLDGISSVIILQEALQILNPKYKGNKKLIAHFPDRENEGYGITTTALDYLQKFSPGIFIALDCGITNFYEVDLAKKLGFRVVIIDHHQIIEKLPKADIVINPKRKDDPYPFKKFSAAGITYKIAKYILNNAYQSWKPESFLELVALATLADQMPLEDENKQLVDDGLLALKYTTRVGLVALKEVTKYQEDDQMELFQKIIAPLNSSERIGNLTESYLLLTTNSKREAKSIAKDLYQKSIEKKEKIYKIIEDVEQRIASQDLPIIYEADPLWPTVMIGVVASKICQKYKKPTFLFKITEKEAICSARLPKEYDGVEAMRYCEHLLVSFGGHPPACGCRLKKENLEEFKNCLIDYFKNK